MFDGDIEFYSEASGRVSTDGSARPELADEVQLGALAARWLTQLCSTVPGISAAVLELANSSQPQRWTWGDDSTNQERLDQALTKASTTQQPILEPATSESGHAVVAVPVAILPRTASHQSQQGSLAVCMDRGDERQMQIAAELISRNLGWLDLMIGSTPDHGATPAESLHGLLATLHTHPRVEANCLEFVTRLATEFNCAQVTIGVVKPCIGRQPRLRDVEVLAISGLAEFDPRRQRVKNLAEVMLAHHSQMARGGSPVCLFDPSEVADEPSADPALVQLSDNTYCASISATAVNGIDMLIVCEWPLSASPSMAQLNRLIRCSELLLPALATQVEARPSLLSRLSARVRDPLARLFGAGYLRTKLIFLAVLAAFLGLALMPMDFRIAAPLTVEGSTQRALTAPFDTFVQASHALPGMQVKKGSTLVEFDASELELSREKWNAERRKLDREYDRALSELDHSGAKILQAQIKQADAELQLVEQQIARTKLIAPFDGVVIKGDLSRSIGAPFERGDVLLELAPLDGYRVVLSVDERDVSAVKAGQRGMLTLAAMPHEHWAFTVRTVASAAPDDDGVHRFRVEAELENPSAQLRPGMQGIGKVEVGEASPLFIATRRFLGWVHLNIWSRLP